jgi:hypothetical protein
VFRKTPGRGLARIQVFQEIEVRDNVMQWRTSTLWESFQVITGRWQAWGDISRRR